MIETCKNRCMTLAAIGAIALGTVGIDVVHARGMDETKGGAYDQPMTKGPGTMGQHPHWRGYQGGPGGPQGMNGPGMAGPGPDRGGPDYRGNRSWWGGGNGMGNQTRWNGPMNNPSQWNGPMGDPSQWGGRNWPGNQSSWSGPGPMSNRGGPQGGNNQWRWNGPQGMGGPGTPGNGQRMEHHLNGMKTHLAITPEQETAWNDFTSTIKEQMAKQEDIHRAMYGMTTENRVAAVKRRLDSMERMMENHRALLKAKISLFESLDDQQKIRFGQTLAGCQHGGHGMHH